MNKYISVSLWVILATFIFQPVSFAADHELGYPELMVTPRASERLALEAKKENEAKFAKHTPIIVSGAVTMVAGFMFKGDGEKKYGLLGIGVGTASIATGLLLGAFYTPYQSGLESISGLPHGSQREKLIKERLAEESIDRTASIARSVKWLSFASNLVSNVLMYTATEKGLSQYVALGGAVGAFLPILFSYNWIDVSNEQKSYKKKIYGPITGTTILTDPKTSRIAGIGPSFTFVF